MRQKNEILDELGQLSMVVAAGSRQLPYGVPEGYFSEFPEKMLARVKQEAGEETFVPAWGKNPTLDVPVGYFEGFADRMMDRIKAEAGRLSNEPLIGQNEGEFSPLLSRIGKGMPYLVPEGYFETPNPLVEPVLHSELTRLKDIVVYDVPEGYFETLSDIVVARVHPIAANAAPAKVISISRSRRVWWKYSAAAVVAGLIFTIGWLRLHVPTNKGLSNADLTQGLTKVSDLDIDNYVDGHTAQNQQEQQEEAIANSTASMDIQDTDVKSFLGDVSDGELTQYMEEHGNLKDYPTN
jgi:hypothetical protein